MANMGTEPMDLAWCVAAGQFNESVHDTLQRGFATFIDAGGKIPLERCLRLPTSTARFRLTQRDRWLVEVARSTEGTTCWARSVAVSQDLDVFLSRGAWKVWRDMQDPPPGTNGLRVALFYTAKFNNGKGLSPKQVDRIVGHLF